MTLYLSAPNLEFVMILAVHGHPNQATASNGTWNYSNYVLQALIQAELGEQDVGNMVIHSRSALNGDWGTIIRIYHLFSSLISLEFRI